MKKKYRIEFDTKGPIKVENTKLWGAQTQRSLENFRIGSEKIPVEVIIALGFQKKAAAMTNMQLNKLNKNLGKTILKSSDEIIVAKIEGCLKTLQSTDVPNLISFTAVLNADNTVRLSIA